MALAAALELLAPDLRFLLAGREVDHALQANIAATGFTTISLFSLIADTRGDLRAALHDPPFNLNPNEGGLDPSLAAGRRVQAARLLDAWETARSRVEEKKKLQAEQRASRLPLTLNATEHVKCVIGLKDVALSLRYQDKSLYDVEQVADQELH